MIDRIGALWGDDLFARGLHVAVLVDAPALQHRLLPRLPALRQQEAALRLRQGIADDGRGAPVAPAVQAHVHASDAPVPAPGQAADLDEATPICIFPDGVVMTYPGPCTSVNLRALALASRSVYFAVSQPVMKGSLPSLSRRSHLMFKLPSNPGSNSRTG